MESKKHWGRIPESDSSQRHSSPRDDVTTSKPIKRAADSVLTPRPVDVPSNKRTQEDTPKNRTVPPRPSLKPLKRPAENEPNTKRTAPESVTVKSHRNDNASIKLQRNELAPIKTRDQPEQAEGKTGNLSSSSRREELLRELKAVEDAIARKRARIE